MTAVWSLQRRIPRRAIEAGSLGLAGQLVVSVVSFLVMVTLARTLGPAAFGLFALLYTVLGLMESVQAALITAPHTVISASKDRDEYRRYTSSVAILQGLLAVATGVVFASVATIAFQFDTALGSMLLAMTFASVGWQCQNFWRGVLFTESRYVAALVNDSVTHGLRLALVAVLWMSAGLTGERFFLIVGATCFAGAALGIWQVRGSLTSAIDAFDRNLLREHWKFGHWLCASRIASEMPQYVTAAVVSSTLSVGAYGAYRAGAQLINAANVPLKALESLLRPKLARDAQHGPLAVWHTIQPILLLGTAGFAIFAVILIILREPLLSLIFGSEYAPYTAVIFLLALHPLGKLLRQVLSSAFLAVRLTKTIFVRSILGAVIGSGLGSVAIILFGLPAVGAVTLLSSIVSILWLGWSWRGHIKEHGYA